MYLYKLLKELELIDKECHLPVTFSYRTPKDNSNNQSVYGNAPQTFEVFTITTMFLICSSNDANMWSCLKERLPSTVVLREFLTSINGNMIKFFGDYEFVCAVLLHFTNFKKAGKKNAIMRKFINDCGPGHIPNLKYE